MTHRAITKAAAIPASAINANIHGFTPIFATTHFVKASSARFRRVNESSSIQAIPPFNMPPRAAAGRRSQQASPVAVTANLSFPPFNSLDRRNCGGPERGTNRDRRSFIPEAQGWL